MKKTVAIFYSKQDLTQLMMMELKKELAVDSLICVPYENEIPGIQYPHLEITTHEY